MGNFSPVTEVKKARRSSLWPSFPLNLYRNHPEAVKQPQAAWPSG